MSAVLSLSSPSLDCSDIVTLLQTLGIAGDVTPNRTVANGREEYGCRTIVSTKDQAKSLWTAARKLPGITCAHVSVQQHQSGCVFDVFQDSNCPG